MILSNVEGSYDTINNTPKLTRGVAEVKGLPTARSLIIKRALVGMKLLTGPQLNLLIILYGKCTTQGVKS